MWDLAEGFLKSSKPLLQGGIRIHVKGSAVFPGKFWQRDIFAAQYRISREAFSSGRVAEDESGRSLCARQIYGPTHLVFSENESELWSVTLMATTV